MDPLPAYYFPYEVPIASASFPHLCILCVAGGLFFAGWFCSLLLASSRASRTSLAAQLKELLVAFLSCVCLGFAAFFLCLMVGIYV